MCYRISTITGEKPTGMSLRKNTGMSFKLESMQKHSWEAFTEDAPSSISRSIAIIAIKNEACWNLHYTSSWRGQQNIWQIKELHEVRATESLRNPTSSHFGTQTHLIQFQPGMLECLHRPVIAPLYSWSYDPSKVFTRSRDFILYYARKITNYLPTDQQWLINGTYSTIIYMLK